MTPSISRRELLAGAVASSVLSRLSGAARVLTSDRVPRGRSVPLLHCTDLYRPFADPDDHFDLATVFALAQQGHFELRGILIDYPPPRHNGDPDVQAVAQMNVLTGLSIPVMIGSPRPFGDIGAKTGAAGPADLSRQLERSAGAKAIVEVLRSSASPVFINIAGSSRDVAIAGQAEPGLFSRKCAAVYLNAGSGTRDPSLAQRLEYNVELDPASYAAIFALPCPVYWLPCFEAGPGHNGEPATTGPHASLYTFPQKDVLPLLSDRLQNYFAFAYRHGERNRSFEDKVPRANWLRALEGKRDDDVINFWGTFPREMWCTAGFLHAAGLTATSDGRVVAASEASAPLFTFDPAHVECGSNGITTWTPRAASRGTFILTIRDEQRYAAAMTGPLRELLKTLA